MMEFPKQDSANAALDAAAEEISKADIFDPKEAQERDVRLAIDMQRCAVRLEQLKLERMELSVRFSRWQQRQNQVAGKTINV
jgi:hypothetical protein